MYKKILHTKKIRKYIVHSFFFCPAGDPNSNFARRGSCYAILFLHTFFSGRNSEVLNQHCHVDGDHGVGEKIGRAAPIT